MVRQTLSESWVSHYSQTPISARVPIMVRPLSECGDSHYGHKPWEFLLWSDRPCQSTGGSHYGQALSVLEFPLWSDPYQSPRGSHYDQIDPCQSSFGGIHFDKCIMSWSGLKKNPSVDKIAHIYPKFLIPVQFPF